MDGNDQLVDPPLLGTQKPKKQVEWILDPPPKLSPCAPCKARHHRCSDFRPCLRCVRAGKEDECKSTRNLTEHSCANGAVPPPKQRGRPRRKPVIAPEEPADPPSLAILSEPPAGSSSEPPGEKVASASPSFSSSSASEHDTTDAVQPEEWVPASRRASDSTEDNSIFAAILRQLPDE